MLSQKCARARLSATITRKHPPGPFPGPALFSAHEYPRENFGTTTAGGTHHELPKPDQEQCIQSGIPKMPILKVPDSVLHPQGSLSDSDSHRVTQAAICPRTVTKSLEETAPFHSP